MHTHMISKAVQAIKQKECVVFPTETVYGLGANALCEQSVQKIFQLKKRPPSNPLIVHISSIEQIYSITENISPLEQKLLELFSPGPLSLVLKKKSTIPDNVTAGLDTVGVRIPNHPIALEFLSAVNIPICAPSANISGQPSPTTFEMAKFYMQDKAVILDGGRLAIGIESTVIKVDHNNIYILRPGFITSEMIFEATGIIPLFNKQQEHLSPGTRFPHYKPKAKIYLFEHTIPPINENSALLHLSTQVNTNEFYKTFHFTSIEMYIQNLYATFFYCDQLNISSIYCELPSNNNYGIALRDRLIKAAL